MGLIILIIMIVGSIYVLPVLFSIIASICIMLAPVIGIILAIVAIFVLLNMFRDRSAK